MIAKDIMNYLETYFPLDLQLSFDKCGLQVGNLNQEVDKVMVSLNCDQQTIDSAIAQNCSMLISHHPLLLDKHDAIDTSVSFGKFIEKAIKNDIVVCSLHTCLDRGMNGISMNDWLISLYDVHHIECYDEVQIGKKAILKTPMMFDDFLTKTKEVFQINTLKVAGRKDKLIERIGICGGSGSDEITACKGQVDAFITGDTKYHHGQFAYENDIVFIDVGHHVEVIVEKELIKILKNLPIQVLSMDSQDYFEYK